MAIPKLSELFASGFYKLRQKSKYAAARRIDNVDVGRNGRTTAGGKHAWFNSPVGVIRKPLDK